MTATEDASSHAQDSGWIDFSAVRMVLRVIDTITVFYFFLEYAVRFLCSPLKRRFFFQVRLKARFLHDVLIGMGTGEWRGVEGDQKPRIFADVSLVTQDLATQHCPTIIVQVREGSFDGVRKVSPKEKS